MITAVPALALADCGSAPNSGWGADYAAYAAWCRGCGGTPYNDKGVGCKPGPNWGRVSGTQGYSGGGYSPQLAAAQTIGYSLGYAIGAWLFGGGNDSGAAEAARMREQARSLEEERVRQAAAAEELERKKQRLLGEMKGLDRADLGLKMQGSSSLAFKSAGGTELELKDMDPDNSSCSGAEDFAVYSSREASRREMLVKLSESAADYPVMKVRADWCKLNIPLPPSPAISGYCSRKNAYAARMRDWTATCSVAMDLASSVPAVNAAAKPPVWNSSLPAAIAYCGGVYDGAVKACGGMECVNDAIGTWRRCLDAYEAASPMASAKPARAETPVTPPVRPGAGRETPADGADVKDYLYPGEPPAFPEDPDKPLLNLPNEREASAFLPQWGESGDDYAARFRQSGLYRDIEKNGRGGLISYVWNDVPEYPRGRYPSVDDLVDESLRRIGERESSGIHAACRKAASDMDAEYARLERQGTIRRGDAARVREGADPAVESALLTARKRVLERLDADIRRAIVRSDMAMDKLKISLPVMRQKARETKGEGLDLTELMFGAAPAEGPRR